MGRKYTILFVLADAKILRSVLSPCFPLLLVVNFFIDTPFLHPKRLINTLLFSRMANIQNSLLWKRKSKKERFGVCGRAGCHPLRPAKLTGRRP